MVGTAPKADDLFILNRKRVDSDYWVDRRCIGPASMMKVDEIGLGRPTPMRGRCPRIAIASLMLALSSFALVLLAGGCSKASPPAPAPAASQAKVDPCGGLSAADAASILNIAAADVKGPQHFKEFSCVYRAKDDFYKSVSFNVYPEESAAQAARKLEAEKEGLAVLSPIKALDKLGDEAYRAPDPRVKRLLMRKGRVWVDVTTPSDEASQEWIARIVLKHLP